MEKRSSYCVDIPSCVCIHYVSVYNRITQTKRIYDKPHRLLDWNMFSVDVANSSTISHKCKTTTVLSNERVIPCKHIV